VRTPDGDERTIALVLLDRMGLESDQRARLERIARGELSSERALRELKDLGELFVAKMRQRGEIPE
jgi:hypothetical protein